MRTCVWCGRDTKNPVEIGGRTFCGFDDARGINADCYRVVFLHKPLNGLIWSWLDGWVKPVERVS